MNVKELIEKLQALPESWQTCPVMYMDEVWLKNVEEVTQEDENEYGLQDEEIGVHVRLSPSSSR